MEELNEITQKLKSVGFELKKMYETQRNLELDYDKKREQILIDDNTILTEDVWSLKSNDIFKLYLRDDNRDGFKKLRKLYEHDYHSITTFFKNLDLQFNDGEMILKSNSNDNLLNFIKTHNLKISNKLTNNIKNIDEKINELEVAKQTILDLINNL